MPTSTQPSDSLIRAIKRILRPLVGFMLEHGVNYHWLNPLLKETFVDVAKTDFSLGDKPTTDSRISLLTGVHRKEIKRLREITEDNAEPDAKQLYTARVIGIWMGDKNFLDDSGNPRPLKRKVSNNGVLGFDDLITQSTKDFRPKVVLDEWLNAGIVTIKESLIYLKVDAFIPSQDIEKKIMYLGRNVGDHLAAARSNVMSDDALFLERSVYYDELNDASVKELNDMAREEGMKLLLKINKRALELQQRDKLSDLQSSKESIDCQKRINFGMYFFNDDIGEK